MSRYDQAFIAILVVIIFALGGAGATIIYKAYDAIPEKCPAPLPTWTPPPVSNCPASVALWECIRTSAYRRDI